MTEADAEKTIAKILGALDRERELIRSGQLNGLSDLVEMRERALGDLDLTNIGHNPGIIQGVANISEKARRNAGLLEAAIEGVKDAEKRLNEILKARTTLGTYERDGSKSNGPVGEGNLRKRA